MVKIPSSYIKLWIYKQEINIGWNLNHRDDTLFTFLQQLFLQQKMGNAKSLFLYGAKTLFRTEWLRPPVSLRHPRVTSHCRKSNSYGHKTRLKPKGVPDVVRKRLQVVVLAFSKRCFSRDKVQEIQTNSKSGISSGPVKN